MNLVFEPRGNGEWTAETDRVSYTIGRDRETGDTIAAAVVHHATGRIDRQREYTWAAATLDGAILACRTAERDGFDGWAADGADTPNTAADGGEPPRAWTAADWAPLRCFDCGAPLDGRAFRDCDDHEVCSACNAENERDTLEHDLGSVD